ncbi:hypothetical protein C2W62_03930 [Candidatus Entotheonella serta]|nr:hypothetical protein C2W62_03930 [Candidatus Entotheonella serta]
MLQSLQIVHQRAQVGYQSSTAAMYWQTTVLLGNALLGLAYSQQPRITAAPIPMAKRDGDIEIHQIYKAPIGVDTNYLTMQGSSTKVYPAASHHL